MEISTTPCPEKSTNQTIETPGQQIAELIEQNRSLTAEAGAGHDAPPAAGAAKKKRAPHTNKLSESLNGLPTKTREIIAPATSQRACRALGEKIRTSGSRQ